MLALFERCALGRHSGHQVFGAAFPHPQRLERLAELAPRPGLVEGHAFAGAFLQRGIKGRYSRVQVAVPLSRSPSTSSASPRLLCIVAQ